MDSRKLAGSIFDLLFGILLFLLLIASLIVFQDDIADDPYNIPLIVGLLAIYVPISLTQILQGVLGLKQRDDETSERSKKPSLSEILAKNKAATLKVTSITYAMAFLVAIITFIYSFIRYYGLIMTTMDESIYIGFIVLYFGGFLWLGIIAVELQFVKRDSSALFTIKTKIDNLYRHKISKFQSFSLLIIIITTASSIIVFETVQPDECFHGTNSFSPHAYDIQTSHYNASLENPVLVNQTILESLEKAMRNMTRLQQMGGFPMRSYQDGSRMASDRGFGCPLFPDEFSLQGGTPYIAGVYLDMYAIEPNPVYLNVAKAAADALVAVQDDIDGGFYYDGRRYANGDGYHPHPRNLRRHSILDDNVMQSCMSFLLDVYNVTEDPKYLDAINKGFDCLFDIEKPGGGWPQRSNYEEYSYPSYTTLNDDSMEDVVNLMLKAHHMFPEESKYLAAAERAGRFLIRVQGNGGNQMQTGWAQQYKNDLPAWARAFEPPAICSRQTGKAINMLISIYLETGNETYLEPIPAGVEWLNTSDFTWEEDGDVVNGWSRLYELETDVPIYGIADGGEGKNPAYVYDYEDARDGYSWRGVYGINSSIDDWVKLQQLNNDTEDFLDWKETEPDLASLEDDAKKAVAELNEEFFWLEEDGYIKDSEFVNNADDIIQYLSLAIA